MHTMTMAMIVHSGSGHISHAINLQELQVLLWHFTVPQLNHILVGSSRVSPLSTHQHPHLSLQVADLLQASQHCSIQGSFWMIVTNQAVQSTSHCIDQLGTCEMTLW